MEFIQAIDNYILQFIQQLRTPLLDKIFVFITTLGDNGFIWFCVATFMLLFKKTRKYGIFMIFTVTLIFIFGDKIIKHIFERNRPFVDYPLFPVSELLIKAPKGYSFPSSHAGTSFGAAMSVYFYNKKYSIAAFVLAGLIAFSRLYIYVHYPSDILGGIIFGILVSFAVKFTIDYCIKKYKSILDK